MHEDAVRGACLHCERVHYQPWTKPITRDSPEAEEVSGIRNKFRSDEDKMKQEIDEDHYYDIVPGNYLPTCAGILPKRSFSTVFDLVNASLISFQRVFLLRECTPSFEVQLQFLLYFYSILHIFMPYYFRRILTFSAHF